MDTTGTSNNFAKQGQNLADKTADKVQSGIHGAKEAGNQVADALSSKVEDARSSTGPAIARATDQAQSVSKKTLDTVSAATEKARATMADVGDSVTAYVMDSPIKALLISAAVGAVIGALATSLSRRD
jgi:ElaB/YqjD/DUF883 family membrane-anchored ribosome-binding protein